MMHRALITGAGRGIGKAVAEELARCGHRLVLNYHHSEDQARTLQASLHGLNVDAVLLRFDVTDVDQTRKILREDIKKNGSIDIVVNNAGITKDMLFAGMKFESWDRVIRTTLTGFYAVTQPCILGMLKQNWGRVINIASLAGLAGNPGQTNYSAAKAGLIGATRSLSHELCARGILVNAVAPGFIDTDMLKNIQIDEKDLLRNIPMGRFGRPEEVAKVVAFLAGENASYISGQVIGVNGGML